VQEIRSALARLGKEWLNRAKHNSINEKLGDAREASKARCLTYYHCATELNRVLLS
jgi:hypothetical protein